MIPLHQSSQASLILKTKLKLTFLTDEINATGGGGGAGRLF